MNVDMRGFGQPGAGRFPLGFTCFPVAYFCFRIRAGAGNKVGKMGAPCGLTRGIKSDVKGPAKPVSGIG